MTAKLVPVAAPITGVTITILVLVQAEITPLATVPSAGVTIVGLVNSSVLLMLLVVPAWTNGTISATFTVTNSTVAATDVIILNQKSGTDLYDLMVTAVAAGSFNLTFRTTGGTTTETPIFNFAVIKAVAA